MASNETADRPAGGDSRTALVEPLAPVEGAQAVLHEEAVSVDETDDVTLEEILYQYRAVILDLDRRVADLERRPQFAASLRTRRTGL